MSTRFSYFTKNTQKFHLSKKAHITYIAALFVIFQLILPQNAQAWAGYEEDTNIAIDIPPGNLVRVGREVQIYDFSTNSYHPSEVTFMEDIFSGTRLEVQDLETNEKRIFYMERD